MLSGLASHSEHTYTCGHSIQGLSTDQKVAIALRIAFGMQFLHSKHVIHFDLKAANLLCDLRDASRPVVKIADVGLSKSKLSTFVSGNMRGTLPWMAPELFPSLDCMPSSPGTLVDKVDEKVCMFVYHNSTAFHMSVSSAIEINLVLTVIFIASSL